MTNISNYKMYRGKCKEMSESFIANNPHLVLVRGYYICPMWGKQQHWWCKDPTNNEIYDLTVKQFPTAGVGSEYIEFDGYFECEECGVRFHEDTKGAQFQGIYALCSGECYCRLVGI